MTAVPRIYLDANIFISAYEGIGAVCDHACWLMKAIEHGEITAVSSELTLAELLVKPIETGDHELAAGYEQIFTSSFCFEVMSVHRNILVDAAKLLAHSDGLRLPDAIHLATAQTAGCSAIVSDDRRLRSVKTMKVLPLGPFTVDDILGAPA